MKNLVKLLLLTSALSLWALPVAAQTAALAKADLAYNWDVDSSTLTYPKLLGTKGPFDAPIPGDGLIKTTGSSTSVTENTVGSNPFTLLSVGDVLIVTRTTGLTDVRVIVTRTDAANVVIDTAVDWTGGFAFQWKKFVTGTTVNDGWFDVGNYHDKQVVIEWNQGDIATSVDFRVECKGAGLNADNVQVSPATPGTVTALPVANKGYVDRVFVSLELSGANWVGTSWSQCRVGVQINGADASDAGANLEQVTIYFTGRGGQ